MQPTRHFVIVPLVSSGFNGNDHVAPTPTFRVADVNDHALIVTMMNELVKELSPEEGFDQIKKLLPDDMARALRLPTVRIFIASLPHEDVGLSRADVLFEDPIFRLRIDHRVGYVDQMYVRPSYRHYGIGAELLYQCEEWFRSQQISHVLLHSAPLALRFYERAGYLSNREMFKRL